MHKDLYRNSTKGTYSFVDVTDSFITFVSGVLEVSCIWKSAAIRRVENSASVISSVASWRSHRWPTTTRGIGFRSRVLSTCVSRHPWRDSCSNLSGELGRRQGARFTYQNHSCVNAQTPEGRSGNATCSLRLELMEYCSSLASNRYQSPPSLYGELNEE